MAHARMPIPEHLKDQMTYDPETGELRRRGRLVQSKDRHGYLQVNVDDRVYRGHRIAWFLHTGQQPPDEIDHINGNRADNRWANMRETRRGTNNHNSVDIWASSGLKGAYQRKSGSWYSKLVVNRKVVWRGTFATAQEASAAYHAKSLEFYGPFSPLRRPV